MDLLKPDLISP